jgi:hypothetical protein
MKVMPLCTLYCFVLLLEAGEGLQSSAQVRYSLRRAADACAAAAHEQDVGSGSSSHGNSRHGGDVDRQAEADLALQASNFTALHVQDNAPTMHHSMQV